VRPVIHGWSDAVRSSLLATVVGLVVAVVALGIKVSTTEGPLRVDTVGSRAAAHLGRLDAPQVLDKAVWLGSPVAVGIMAALLAAFAWSWRDRVGAVIALVAPACAGAITEFIAKPLVDRHHGAGYLYPSGHVTGAAAVAAVVVVLAYRRFGGAAASGAAVGAAVLPVVVGIGVVRLGWHFATDALGGLGVGMSVVLGFALLASPARERV
jgi:membrane-associated phospholipid phosphatase